MAALDVIAKDWLWRSFEVLTISKTCHQLKHILLIDKEPKEERR